MDNDGVGAGTSGNAEALPRAAVASPGQGGLIPGVVEPSLVGHMNARRRAIKAIAAQVKELKMEVMMASSRVGSSPVIHDTGECLGNLMLAYRHLEDASMRLGKAIQAADGGVSVYDRDTTVGA